MPTKAEICSLVRRQLLYYLENDLEGDELLMKEVWEQCTSPDDAEAVKQELEAVARMLRERDVEVRYQGLSRAEQTASLVESFATYPLGPLLDELVVCTVRYTLGDLVADERRVVTALLERLRELGLAHKEHREGCEIWPQHQLCKCPWRVPS